jgi:hypothetical protein
MKERECRFQGFDQIMDSSILYCVHYCTNTLPHSSRYQVFNGLFFDVTVSFPHTSFSLNIMLVSGAVRVQMHNPSAAYHRANIESSSRTSSVQLWLCWLTSVDSATQNHHILRTPGRLASCRDTCISMNSFLTFVEHLPIE